MHSYTVVRIPSLLSFFTLKVSKSSRDPIWNALQTAHEGVLLSVFTTKI